MSGKIDLSGLFSGGFSFDLNGDGKGIDDYVEDFIEDAGEVWDDITEGVENAYNDVVDWTTDVAEDVSQWFEDAGAYIANAAESAFNAVGVALDGIASWWENTAAPFLESAGIFILEVLEGTAATVTTILFSLVEGILQFGEALVDLIVMLGTAIASIGTGIYDGCQAIYGAITGEEWESATGNMWESVMGFVAVDGVKTLFDTFYEDTAMGNWMADNTPFFDTVRGISSGIGYVAGIVILTICTFGVGGAAAGAGAAGSSAVTVTAGQLATTAGVIGFSSGTADAWADGATLFEGFGFGALNGLWEATQWYVGGKIGGLNLFGKGAANAGTKLLNAFSRVLLDGFDGSLEGFMQPLLKSLYKDTYYDENGQEIAFTEDDNLLERFVEMFDDAGGFQNVLTQGLIGSGGSLLGEAFDLTKFLKGSNADVTAKIDADTTVTLELDPDRTLTMDLDPDRTLELDDITEQLDNQVPFFEPYRTTETFSKITEFFERFNVGGTFGSNQGILTDLANSVNTLFNFVKTADPRYIDMKNKLIDMGFSKKEAAMIITGVDSVGACSYASVTNEIFSSFSDNPKAFEDVFGYSMYVLDPSSNQYRLNSEELLLDLYLFANDTKNGGQLFNIDPINGSHIDPRALENGGFSAEGQQYMSSIYGKEDPLIDAFLYSKSPDVRYGSILLADHYTPELRDALPAGEMDRIIDAVKRYLETGHNASLGMYSVNGGQIRMENVDPFKSTSTSTWGEGGGHSVFISGIAEDGFEVSSWGDKYIIPFQDLIDGAGSFVITISKIFK